MAGTRTAPTVNGTPTFQTISIRIIDFTGDKKTDTINFPSTATDAELESYVAAYAAITQACVYAVEVKQVYNSVADSQNAENLPRTSAFDVLNILLKDPSANSDSGTVRAPSDGIFILGTDEIDPTDALLITYLTELLNVANGGIGGAGVWEIVSARYTERREINTAVPI